jgi:hypothetical protein
LGVRDAALGEDAVEVDDAVALACVGTAAAGWVVAVGRAAELVRLGVAGLLLVPHAATSVPRRTDAAAGPRTRERTVFAKVLCRVILPDRTAVC